MSLKDQAINLVLSAKNLLSGSVDDAAKSVEQLSGSAQGLRGRLDQLEKQSGLISQFQQAEKAVDRTSLAYEKAQLRVDKMAEKIERSGSATATQAKEFELAQRAVDNAEKAYKSQQETVERLGDQLQDAGVDVNELGKAQGAIAGETAKAEKALEQYNEEVDEGESRLKGLGSTLAAGAGRFAAWGAAAAAAGAALALTAVVRFTKGNAALADQLTNTSLQLGINVENLQRLEVAARTVGVEQGTVASILKDVSKSIGEASQGTGRFVKYLDQLNLDARELVELEPDQALYKIAEAIKDLPPAEQVNILERLGSGASKLIPLLQNNSAELYRIAEAAEARGAIIDEEEVARLVKTQDTLNRVTERLDGLRNKLVEAVGPAFEKFADALDAGLGSQPELIERVGEAMSGLTEKAGEAALYIVEDFDKVAASLQSVVDAAQFIGNGFLAAFRGVQSFAAGTLEVIARVAYSGAELVASITRGMNTIGLATDDAVAAAEFRVANLGATVQDLEAKSKAYKEQMIAAGKAAVTAFDNTEEAGEAAKEALDGATDAAAELTAELEGVGPAADQAAEATVSLAEKQNELRLQLAALVPQIKAAQDELARDVTSDNQSRVQRLVTEYDALGKQLQSLNEISGQTEENITSSADVLSKGVRKAGDDVDETGNKAQRAGVKFWGLADDVKGVGDAAEEAGRKAESSAGTIGAAIANIFNGWTNYIADLSEKAGAAFERALGMGGAAGSASVLEQRLDLVNSRLDDMRGRLTSGGTIGGLIRDMAKAGFETEQSFLKQAIAVEQLTDRILEGDRSASILAMSAADVARNFDLLDDGQLRPLIGAIQSAQREVESLNKSLQNTIASARQELASLRGDTEAVEVERYEQRRLELQQQYDYARKLGDRETMEAAKEALQLTEQAYNLRLKQARERTEEAKQRALEAEANKADERLRAEAQTRQQSQETERRTQTQVTQLDRAITAAGGSRTVTLNFAAGGQRLGTVNALDESQVNQLIDALARAGYLAAG